MPHHQPVPARPHKIVVMGVCGSGKSLIGNTLAQNIGAKFLDGDDLHPEANRTKMTAGTPLDDADRWPWLEAVGEALASAAGNIVVACSSLKRSYRNAIRDAAPGTCFIHLHGSESLLAGRLQARTNHFMPPALLESQLRTLEPLGQDEGILLNIESSPEDIVATALNWLNQQERTPASR